MEQTHKPMEGLFLRINLQNAKESQSQVHNGTIGIFWPEVLSITWVSLYGGITIMH